MDAAMWRGGCFAGRIATEFFARTHLNAPAAERRKPPIEMEFAMEIATTRFGRLDVNEERIISFPKGLLGFPQFQRYALIQTGEENYFFWLQSVDEPTLAFVVTDPAIFFKDYDFALKEETQQEIGLTDAGFAQVFVICNKVGDWLTGNLQGPLVINAQNRVGNQIVINDKKWTTRQPLLRLQADVPLAKSA
jgi:flagellar assembly factor FliW